MQKRKSSALAKLAKTAGGLLTELVALEAEEWRTAGTDRRGFVAQAQQLAGELLS